MDSGKYLNQENMGIEEGLAYKRYWDGYNVLCYLLSSKNICDTSTMPSEIYLQALIGLLITPQCICN